MFCDVRRQNALSNAVVLPVSARSMPVVLVSCGFTLHGLFFSSQLLVCACAVILYSDDCVTYWEIVNLACHRKQTLRGGIHRNTA